MPTYGRTEQFDDDWQRMAAGDRDAFRAAVKKFLADLPARKFRKGLRVKRVEGTEFFELTWAGADGRATFQFGKEIHEGEPHIIWRRIGGHEIFRNP